MWIGGSTVSVYQDATLLNAGEGLKCDYDDLRVAKRGRPKNTCERRIKKDLENLSLTEEL